MLKKYLAVTAASLMALNATAQSDFSQLVVFGDSILDAGNITGRKFTNQKLDGSGFATIAPEYLADYLGVSSASVLAGGTNYAVGGNQTLNILGTIVDPALLPDSTIDPSFTAGVVAPPFETVVGVPPYTPTGTVVAPPYLTTNIGFVQSGSLVLIDGGGNDVIAIALSGFDEATITGLVQASATHLVTSIATLSANGANYIMAVNLPDLGKVAFGQAAAVSEVASGTGAATINETAASTGLSDLSAGYNKAVSAFSALKLTDANVIPVDLNGLITYVMDNTDSYGLASGEIDIAPAISAPNPVLFDQRYMCYDGSGGECIEHPVYGLTGTSPDPRRLFFNDTLHPTEIASEIVGDYMIDILAAPKKVALLPEMTLTAARTQISVSGDELRRSRWGKAEGRVFISGDVSTDEYEVVGIPETETQGLTIGRMFVASDTLAYGIALTVGQQELDLDGADFESDSWGLSGLLGYRQNDVFIDAQLGLSLLSYDDLRRDVKLGSQTLTATGDTDGHAWTVDMLAGFDILSSQKWHLAPAVGVQYISSTVDAYTESGGEVSNYYWGEQRRKSLQWRYGLVASGSLSDTVEIFGEVFSSREQEDEAKNLNIRNTNLNFPAYSLPGYDVDDSSFVTATVGGSLNIMSTGSLSLTYNYSNRGDGYEHVAFGYSMPI